MMQMTWYWQILIGLGAGGTTATIVGVIFKEYEIEDDVTDCDKCVIRAMEEQWRDG
jgi:hypothetical protein